MSTRKDKGAAARAFAGAAGVLGLAGVAMIGAGCSQPAREDAAPLTTNTTVVVPATHNTRVVSSRELPGTDNGDPTAAVTNTNAGPGGAAGTAETVAGRIDAAIIHDTQMTGSRVAAVVDSAGIATLNGTVQNAQQKALAEKAAKDTPGVVSLKNKLEIRPTGGAGASQPAQSAQSGASSRSSRRITSLTVGDGGGSSAANGSSASGGGRTATGGTSSQQPRIVVVNNYVPVPSQQGQDTSNGDNSVSGAYNGGYADGAAAASRDGYYGSYGGYGNPVYGYGNSYGYANGYNAPNGNYGPASVLDSSVVPGYLRNMANANDYMNYARDSGNY